MINSVMQLLKEEVAKDLEALILLLFQTFLKIFLVILAVEDPLEDPVIEEMI